MIGMRKAPSVPTCAPDRLSAGRQGPLGACGDLWGVGAVSLIVPSIAFAFFLGAISDQMAVEIGGLLLILTYLSVLSRRMDVADRRDYALMQAIIRDDRERTTEYGAIMRKVNSVSEQAEQSFAHAVDRIEEMIVACDAAEARRNVERTDQMNTLSETYASELLALNGALCGLRSAMQEAAPTIFRNMTTAEAMNESLQAAGIPGCIDVDTSDGADPIRSLLRDKLESGDLWSSDGSKTPENV